MHPKASKFIRRATYKKMAAARQRITNAEDADREESERLFQLNRLIEADQKANKTQFPFENRGV